MAKRAIRFYFDYISPNAYLAWTQLPALANRHQVTIEPVPVLFAGLLEAHRQLGPAEVPAKMHWMWKNALRKAALLGVELNPPAFHPFNPLLALRVSSLVLSLRDQNTLIDALFAAVWVRGLHLAEQAVMTRVINEAGLDGAQMVAQAQQPDAKARLRDQTDSAIALGIFGVPTVVFGSEMFWGYDDLPFVERALSGLDALNSEQLQKWSAVGASAARARKQAPG